MIVNCTRKSSYVDMRVFPVTLQDRLEDALRDALQEPIGDPSVWVKSTAVKLHELMAEHVSYERRRRED